MASYPRLLAAIHAFILYYFAAACCSCCFAFRAPIVYHHPLKPRSCYDVSSSYLRSSTAEEANVATTTESMQMEEQRDLHPPTLNAITEALLIRAQNVKDMPMRILDDDGSIEPWEITLTCGKIAQQSVEEWMKQEQLTLQENEDEMQVVAGRVVAVLTRLDELEEELLKRCNNLSDEKSAFSLGVPLEELNASQISEKAAAIDAACLFDQQLRYNRAKSLLAMFLHEIEGPGLRRNNVVLPCMDVDFLSEEQFNALLVTASDVVDDSSEQNSVDIVESVVEEKVPKQSLHPVTIDAIVEAFILRAQNVTTSPLRLLDSNMEWFEVQYSIVKFADRFLEKLTKGNKNGDVLRWTEEELQTIAGRIVGVLIRLDDLEWEWNHRVCSSILGDPDSPDMIPFDEWKPILGLHPKNVEQNCIKTLDMALLEEEDFARVRAERMLALFLLNIEGPGLKASGSTVPGGSEVEFIRDEDQLALMMPKLKE